MENYRDTPITRISAFLWGLALIVAFGIIAFGLRWVLTKETRTADDYRAQDRLAARLEVDSAQAALLEPSDLSGGNVQLAPELIFPALAEQLLASKPVAVRDNQWVVPGTPTFERLNPAPAPAEEPAADDAAAE